MLNDIPAPWQTDAGRKAEQVRLRLLAAGDGELAEFASEVLAGRAKTRDLLYSSILSDNALQGVRDSADAWHALPESERQTLVADAPAATERRIEALNALAEPETDTPTDQEDGGFTILSDAW